MRRIYPREEEISDARLPYKTGMLGNHPYPVDDFEALDKLRQEKQRKIKENLPEQKSERNKKEEKIVRKSGENPKGNLQTSLF